MAQRLTACAPCSTSSATSSGPSRARGSANRAGPSSPPARTPPTGSGSVGRASGDPARSFPFRSPTRARKERRVQSSSPCSPTHQSPGPASRRRTPEAISLPAFGRKRISGGPAPHLFRFGTQAPAMYGFPECGEASCGASRPPPSFSSTSSSTKLPARCAQLQAHRALCWLRPCRARSAQWAAPDPRTRRAAQPRRSPLP
mmetsp:Transcript_12440/g.35794  ORF Transcript_12440/g.35794 Transcript_12440/m.35794 type:complete len:201 (-) Transcript_12440:815-1417(-)